MLERVIIWLIGAIIIFVLLWFLIGLVHTGGHR